MAYVKLDTGILNSTLWIDRDCRELFITALLMAEPREFAEPVEQIKVDSLDMTGWSAPPGWYGYVPAAGVGIIARCGVDRTAGMAALARLGSIENDSRNPEFEGRRMIRMDGGYIILNYMRYRDKDHTAAKRQQALRDRKKAAAEGNVTRDDVESRRDVALPSRNVTESDADADADAKKTEERNRASRATRLPADFGMTPERRGYAEKLKLNPIAVMEAFVDYWNAACGANARKCDWEATWRTWCRRQGENWKSTKGQPVRSGAVDYESMEWREALSRGAAINFRKPWPMETPDSYTTAVKLEENRPPARDFSRVLKRVQA